MPDPHDEVRPDEQLAWGERTRSIRRVSSRGTRPSPPGETSAEWQDMKATRDAKHWRGARMRQQARERRRLEQTEDQTGMIRALHQRWKAKQAHPEIDWDGPRRNARNSWRKARGIPVEEPLPPEDDYELKDD